MQNYVRIQLLVTHRLVVFVFRHVIGVLGLQDPFYSPSLYYVIFEAEMFCNIFLCCEFVL